MKPKNKTELITAWILGLSIVGIWMYIIPTYFFGREIWTPTTIIIAIIISIGYTYMNHYVAINYDKWAENRRRSR
jgi:hypothetical protein